MREYLLSFSPCLINTVLVENEAGLQGLIPWGFIVHMIRHRGLKALLLGRNKFQAHELPHDLDLNGLEELDLSGNGSLGGRRYLHFICWAMCELHGFV